MEIEIKTKTVPFEEVPLGAVFSYEGELYMKVIDNEVEEVNMGARLKDGLLRYDNLYDSTPVGIVSGKFIVN